MQLTTLHNNEPLVSHRIIATNTKNQASSIQKLITRYAQDFEEFGYLFSQIENIKNSKNKINQQKTYYLNEQQATLLLTYLKNTEIIRNFKKALVKEFYKIKIKHQNYVINGYKSQIAQHNAKINSLKNISAVLAQVRDERDFFKKEYLRTYEALGNMTDFDALNQVMQRGMHMILDCVGLIL